LQKIRRIAKHKGLPIPFQNTPIRKFKQIFLNSNEL